MIKSNLKVFETTQPSKKGQMTYDAYTLKARSGKKKSVVI